MGSPIFSGNNFFAPLRLGTLEFDLSAPTASTITIANNSFDVSNSGAVISIPSGPNVEIANNKINGCDTTEIGIEVQEVAGTNFVVTGNEICHCTNGVIIQRGNVQLSQNSIFNNSIGISINPYFGNQVGDGTVIGIYGNTISNNSVGVQYFACASTVNITNNDFNGNIQYNFVLKYNKNITAPNNYWGTTDEDTISQSIYDGKDDSNLGLVTFTPFNGQASEQEVNPEPTALVSDQILIIAYAAVAIFCVVIAAIILQKRRKIKKN